MHRMPPYFIGLVGDSDIARWPIHLLPNVEGAVGGDDDHNTTCHPNSSHVLVSGHSGMTLQQILPYVKDMITTLLLQCDTPSQPRLVKNNPLFVVVCGGENDIGGGIPLSDSKLAFQSLLDLFHETNIELPQRHRPTTAVSIPQPHPDVHLLFLGPKFEPWFVNDTTTRKSYIQMSVMFEQLCQQQQKHNANTSSYDLVNNNIHYMDCLTMFCGTTNQRGALYGGKALPDTLYFHSDQLHLSDDGYAIWKTNIEDTISAILSATGQDVTT